MARIYPLFSSSKGNSSFVGSPSGGVLIDVGVSFKRLSQALDLCGIPLDAIRGVFITHGHSDHVKGLKTLTKRLDVPVWGQPKTLGELIASDCFSENADVREISGEVTVGDMEVRCFNTLHDTMQSCGYRVNTADGRSCAVCTDLGHVTDTVEKAISGCDLVLLEANYDENMLKNGSYPDWLKRRIASKHGHLSNSESARQAVRLIKSGTTRIILGHLSQENNTPQKAETTVLSALGEFKRNSDYILSVAPVETRGEMAVF